MAADAGQERRHPTFHRVKGRVKRALGWLTADRHVEAAGEAELRTGRQPDPQEVEVAEQDVKSRYGEGPG